MRRRLAWAGLLLWAFAGPLLADEAGSVWTDEAFLSGALDRAIAEIEAETKRPYGRPPEIRVSSVAELRRVVLAEMGGVPRDCAGRAGPARLDGDRSAPYRSANSMATRGPSETSCASGRPLKVTTARPERLRYGAR